MDAWSERVIDLEERVRKLEFSVTERPTQELMEDAVADRVLSKLAAAASEPRSPENSERVLVLASTADVPASSAMPGIPPPPRGAVLHPPEVSPEANRGWLLVQVLSEFRLAVRMYFDPRYRISRTLQFALPGIMVLLVLDYLFFKQWLDIAFFSPFCERLIAVMLGVMGYKILARELVRYRDVLDYLSRYGQR
jgi:hypothetical protein